MLAIIAFATVISSMDVGEAPFGRIRVDTLDGWTGCEAGIDNPTRMPPLEVVVRSDRGSVVILRTSAAEDTCDLASVDADDERVYLGFVPESPGTWFNAYDPSTGRLLYRSQGKIIAFLSACPDSHGIYAASSVVSDGYGRVGVGIVVDDRDGSSEMIDTVAEADMVSGCLPPNGGPASYRFRCTGERAEMSYYPALGDIFYGPDRALDMRVVGDTIHFVISGQEITVDRGGVVRRSGKKIGSCPSVRDIG
jgi:hypothetical protein